MKVLTHNFHSIVLLYFASDGNIGRNKRDQTIKSCRYGFFGINVFLSIKGDRMIFRFKLKLMWSPSSLKVFFPSDIKVSFYYHITTSPNAQINCPVPMNMILYENKTFFLTFFKHLEKSQYFLCILLLSIRRKNHLDSEKINIFRETFMK